MLRPTDKSLVSNLFDVFILLFDLLNRFLSFLVVQLDGELTEGLPYNSWINQNEVHTFHNTYEFLTRQPITLLK